jgi:molecular chaperone GrpE
VDDRPTDQPDGDVVEGEVVADRPDPEPPTPETLGIELPADPAEAESLLLAEVGRARSQAASHLDDLRRVAADFENYRRRTSREQSEATVRAAEALVRDLLPVLDSFDAALAVEPSTEAEEKLLAGMRRTHEQLLAILQGQGLDVVPTVGEPFDPERHEAVMAAPEGEGALVVSAELRRGYLLKDRLVRAALVALDRERD